MTPGTSRSRRCTASSSSRCRTRTPGAKPCAERIFVRLVGDDGDLAHALGFEQAGDRRHVEIAGLHLLAAGHGDRVVVEDLEGDVGAGRDGGADRQRARVVEGAVADVLEDMRARAERRLAEPGRALAAHLGEAAGVAVHPLDHEVAADAGQRLASPRARGSSCCAGSRGRNRAAAPWPGRSRPRRARPAAAPPGARAAAASSRCASSRSAIAMAIWFDGKAAVARKQRRARRVVLALDHWPAAAGGRAAPWPGSRSGRASPRPRAPARARAPPRPAPPAPAARSCRPCRRAGPARGRAPSSIPRSSRAAITSSQDLPVVTMPSRAPAPPAPPGRAGSRGRRRGRRRACGCGRRCSCASAISGRGHCRASAGSDRRAAA